jgi:hypothetical protein
MLYHLQKHGVTSQKAKVTILNTMRTPDLIVTHCGDLILSYIPHTEGVVKNKNLCHRKLFIGYLVNAIYIFSSFHLPGISAEWRSKPE